MSDKPDGSPYDKKAAAWTPTLPPYELFEDEKELFEQMKRGEIKGEIMVNGKMVPAKFVNNDWVPAKDGLT